MDIATRKELAERWGYALEFAGYVSKDVAEAALREPKSDNGQCLELVAQNPMVVLARVHALFSHLEAFLREGSLLPGPAKHQYATDEPAYEFPTGDSNLRVLARKMPHKPNWLLTAWSSNGVEQDATVQIPDLAAVTVHGRAVGSVYTARIEGGKPILIQVDAE